MIKKKIIRRVKVLKRILLLSILAGMFFISFFSFSSYLKKLNAINTNASITKTKEKHNENPIINNVLNNKVKSKISQDIKLRKFPYPYSAMLALCSDIDDTTLDNFKIYHQFLNTKENTVHGQGLGLDVGDSMWLYMGDNYSNANNVMTYYKGIDINKQNNADAITHYIKSGWIDCLHTFGDFSTDNEKGSLFERNLAVNGWKTLNGIGFKPKVWINHGNRANLQNFGATTASSFMSYQHGDDPKDNYYHTDITIGNGIKYVWNSQNSSTFGHDFPLFTISLRDGRKVWGFRRYTNVNSNGKIDWVWTPDELHREITQNNLDSIVNNRQYCILAQHLGVKANDLFKKDNLKALYLLKQYKDENKILIANTTRLLDYSIAQRYLKFNETEENGVTYINILCINDPLFGTFIPNLDDLRGITFYKNDVQNTVLLINNNVIDTDKVQINPKDETGQASIGIKWFPPDYTDYTKINKHQDLNQRIPF